MKTLAGVSILAFVVWASWPSLDAFPDLPPEDAEALRLIRDLERGRPGSWEAIVRARNPRTVPALMARESRDTLSRILHPAELVSAAGGPPMERPRDIFCCEYGQRPHPPADAFERALQAAVLEGDEYAEFKRRSCAQAMSFGQYELETLVKDSEPGIRFAAAFQLWKSGAPRAIPGALAMLGDHSFTRHPWLEPIAEALRREMSTEAIMDGVRKGRRREIAAAACLKLREAVEEIVRQLNDPARKAAWDDLAWVLGEIGDPSATAALIDAMRRGGYFLKGDAAEALGKIGDRSALPALRAELEREPKGYVRAHLERAIASFRP